MIGALLFLTFCLYDYVFIRDSSLSLISGAVSLLLFTTASLSNRSVGRRGKFLSGSADTKTPEATAAKERLESEIEERKRNEEELQASQNQLRNLLARFRAIREEERTDLARELHDELGQILTVLKMDVSVLRNYCKDNRTVFEKAKAIMDNLDDTIETVRRILSRLRPGVLDHLGLAAAIEWEAKDFQERTGIACSCSIRPAEISMDNGCSTALFRVLQEALANAYTHSGADRIRISLREEKGAVVLSIRDNGRGITPEEIGNPGSLGLAAMKESMRMLEGDLEVKGLPGKGTIVRVFVPLQVSFDITQ